MPVCVLQIFEDHSYHLVRFGVLDQARGALENQITNHLLTVAQLFDQVLQNGCEVLLEGHKLLAKQICYDFDGSERNFEVDIRNELVNVGEEGSRVFFSKLGFVWWSYLLGEQFFDLFHGHSPILPLIILVETFDGVFWQKSENESIAWVDRMTTFGHFCNYLLNLATLLSSGLVGLLATC